MRRGFALGFGLLIVLVGPQTASAGTLTEGGFRYVRDNVELIPGQTKTLRKTCPNRQQVLGGGGTTDGLFGEAYLSGSFPYDAGDKDSKPDDGWKVRVSSFDRVVHASVYAVCSRLQPTYRTGREEVPAGDDGGDNASCGSPERAIVHGGYRGPLGIVPTSSYPFDGMGGDVWSVEAWNVTNDDLTVTTYAICSDDLPVIYAGSTFAAPTGMQAFGQSDCPSNAPNVVGGGPLNLFSGLGETRLVSDLLGLRDQPAPDGWTVEVDNEGPQANVTIWAVCAADIGSLPR
jgi:hypothetical protein